MIRKSLKYIGLLILIYSFLCLIAPFNKFLRKRSISNQINYLSRIMDEGYDDELQKRFPEGKLFSNAILALSVIEYCDKYSVVTEKYSTIVDKCISRIQSEKTLDSFNPNLRPAYGIFYNGWTNYVYNEYRNSKLFKLSTLIREINEGSRLIEERIEEVQKNGLEILDSYAGANWPADNLVGIISLTNDSLKHELIDKIISEAEHKSGLIHHSGSDFSNIRGSSSAMITFCLNKMNYENIEAYNANFKQIFVDEILGVQLVRENEDRSNNWDVDSGPVLFGFGASATIMNIKTQASMNGEKIKWTWAVMNLISLPINIFGQKYHLLKKEPMFDLFMLWGSVEL